MASVAAAAAAEGQGQGASGEESEAASEARHGVGNRSQYYDKWDKLAQEEVRKAEEEERESKISSDAALGLDNDAPVSAAQKADLEKRKVLQEERKKYEEVDSHREKQKVTIEGIRGSEAGGEEGGGSGESSQTTEKVFSSFQGDLNSRRVVVLKNNEDCRFEFPAELDSHNLIKLFVDSCRRCTIVLRCAWLTQCVEVSHCADVVFEIRRPLATFQVDLSERVRLRFAQNTLKDEEESRHRIYHASVSGITVEYEKDGNTNGSSLLTTGEMNDLELAEKEKNMADAGKAAALDVPLDEVQFITRLRNGALVTDRVLRDAGNHPTTQRDIDARKATLINAMREKGMDPESKEAKKMLNAESPLDALTRAKQSKEKGNEMFKGRDYGQAMLFYSQAVDALGGDQYQKKASAGSVDDSEIGGLLAACLSNRAACALKLGQHENALKDARSCTAIDPTHVRGTFRLGLALHALERYREACPVLSKALSMQPGNKQIKTALQFAERRAAMSRR